MTDLAVIMSVYQKDRLDFLKLSVESILAQTYSDFDFLIAFDGPVSVEINSYFSSLGDFRVKLFKIEQNKGLARSLNHLLEKVLLNREYEFIARMDADDISLSSRFEKQRNFLLSNPEISCVGSWYEEIDEKGQHISYRNLPVNPVHIRKVYFTRAPLAHPSVMYRRGLIEKAGFYPVDTMLMEDNALWGNALKQDLNFSNIPEYLLLFRIDENFYRRRSGLKYGWNYIKTKLNINKSLSTPFYIYIINLGTGILKMAPSCLVKIFYKLYRKRSV